MTGALSLGLRVQIVGLLFLKLSNIGQKSLASRRKYTKPDSIFSIRVRARVSIETSYRLFSETKERSMQVNHNGNRIDITLVDFFKKG